MKRSEMQLILARYLQKQQNEPFLNGFLMLEASRILDLLEESGMKPPRLPEEICQAIMHIYYAGYSLNQWEEDALKDEKVVAELKRRAEYKALSPEEKKQRRMNAVARLNRLRGGQ